MATKIEIYSNEEGAWEPDRELVRKLLKQMAVGGLRSDWQCCSALSRYALLFCDNSEDTQIIEARRKPGSRKWDFFTDSGFKLVV